MNDISLKLGSVSEADANAEIQNGGVCYIVFKGDTVDPQTLESHFGLSPDESPSVAAALEGFAEGLHEGFALSVEIGD